MDNPPPSTPDLLAQHLGQTEKLFSGGVMIDPSYARKYCGWLEPSQFRDDRLGRYWAAVKGGKDPHQVAMELGLYLEVAGYMSQVLSSYDTIYYAQTISADRYLLEASSYLSDIARAIADRDITTVRSLAGCVASASPYTGEAIPSAQQISREFEELLDNIDGEVELTRIPPMDNATGGLEKQTLTVIGARPSMGKTSLGSQIAQLNAKACRKVIYFSLEMSRTQLWARMACGRMEISWRDVLAKKVTPAQIEAIRGKSRELAYEFSDNLLIEDKAMMTNEDIYRKVANIGPDLIIVDHMDLVNRNERGKLREDMRVGNISRYGKTIAKEFNIPTIYLVQLNRDTEKRDNKRPTMADLRNSGEIEQDADNIFFMYRPDYYEDASAEPPKISNTEIIVAKFRNGIRNIQVNLKYNLPQQWFYGERKAP